MAAKHIVVIGASTGGPRVVPELFAAMPPLPASIILVQHMPQYINDSLVRAWRRHTTMTVRIAQTGDCLYPGVILVAPSGWHCRLHNNEQIVLSDDPAVNYVRPSIDVTMQSLTRPAPRQCLVGVVLTGMGCDGAAGLTHIKSIGGITMVQDLASCAVSSMPAEALKTGHVDYVLPPAQIGRALGQLIGAEASSSVNPELCPHP